MINQDEKLKVPKGSKRSPHWARVRKMFLQDHKTCALCGGKKKLEVHHVKPFHLHPELELDLKNLITLCENNKVGVNCHLLFGHLGCFKSVNADVRKDSEAWNSKITKRPKGDKE